MKVAGLNNQAFQSTAKAAGGKASQGKEKSSFESVLGEAQANDRGENNAAKDSTSGSKDQPQQEYKQKSAPQESNVKATQTKKSPVAQTPEQTAVKGEVSAKQQESSDDSGFSAEALPTGQGAPTLGSPGLTDRTLAAPQVNPAYINPVNAPAQGMKQDDAANTLTRRVVWNDFLRKMNDLGVSAEDVLHAFGSLSEKDLAQPPELSMDKIVSALGLNGQQATLAKQYFGDLIAKTKSKSFGEEVTASGKQLSLSLMSQRDLQRKNLLKSIDNLGNNFFMNKTSLPEARLAAQQPMIGEDGKPMAVPLPENQAQNFSQLENPNMLTGNALALPGIPNGLPQVASESATSEAPAIASAKGSEMNGLVGQMQAPAAEDKKSIDQLIKNFTSRQMKSPEAAIAAAPAAVAAAAGPTAAAVPAGMPASAMAALNGIFAGGKGKESAGEDAADDGGNSSGINSALMPQNHLANSEGVKGEFASAMAKAPGSPQQMAVPELMQQANLMVRDGGGDMKVTLHPDGMGEVALRVSVTDGKVNVQMITESDEAKRMIEHQIGDLKAGLSNNHLQVDSIKVDTATNLGKQLEQQYHEAQRQQAQQSLEQFRQEGGGQWRRSFFDTGVVNPYRTQGDAPRDSSAPSTARARSVDGSRRLDLVA